MISLKPEFTALIIVDMQSGFLDDGAPIYTPGGKSIVDGVIRLIEMCRKAGVHVIWTQSHVANMTKGIYPELFPNHFDEEGNPKMSRYTGDYYTIIAELIPFISRDDTVVHKDRYSAFFQTNLDLILRERSINTLLFAGVTTNVCVEGSIRDAFNLNYTPIMVSDCTATFTKELQHASEQVVSFVFGHVRKIDEISFVKNQ